MSSTAFDLFTFGGGTAAKAAVKAATKASKLAKAGDASADVLDATNKARKFMKSADKMNQIAKTARNAERVLSLGFLGVGVYQMAAPMVVSAAEYVPYLYNETQDAVHQDQFGVDADSSRSEF